MSSQVTFSLGALSDKDAHQATSGDSACSAYSTMLPAKEVCSGLLRR